jgi:KDO2-lipid IV(A) lauroyltransferase
MSISYIAYFLSWKFIGILPNSVAYSLSGWAADQITVRNGKGVQRLRFNYARVHPEFSELQLEEAVKKGMRSYLRYWTDTFRLPKWSDEKIVSTVQVTNDHYLRDAMKVGKGCIVSLPHAGNWDHAGAYYCKTGAPIVTVAEHLQPEKLFRKFLKYRESLGMEVLDASARSLATLSQRLRQGRLVALVADRDLSQNGIAVELCGYPARMPGGPALLSLQTGAPLITAYVTYSEYGLRIHFEGPIHIPDTGSQSEKVSAMIQETATRLERHLKESITDWHMLQRIWVDGDFEIHND